MILPSSRWIGIHAPRALGVEQLAGDRLNVGFGLARGGVRRIHLFELVGGQVIADGVGQDEVAVGQALHEGARAQAIGAVIAEIGFADDVQSGDIRHQVVIHPQAAHGVVDGGIDAHRLLVRIFAGDALVHVEQVAVALLDDGAAEALDGVAEVQVDGQAAFAHAAAFVADLLGIARGHVARHQVAEARVLALQEVIAFGFGDLAGRRACRPSSAAPTRGRRCAAIRSSG